MTTFKKQITINSSQQKVWNIISDLGAIQKFHPGVSKSYYTTDKTRGFGAARICELQPSGKILETVKQWNEGTGFLLQIDPIEKAPPVKSFNGLFELMKINENQTEASLTVDYEMKLGAIGILLNKLIIQSKMEENIEALLEGLKIHSEKGLEITDVKSLQKILKAA
ncbi:MAG: SRPBCC family protein [Flavobacteriales bacterium]|nr:SRPBCC family protein [Flavobacteriales bacterium]NQX98696.1 SRPBCC family protein [Flavobacteriales bacterium]